MLYFAGSDVADDREQDPDQKDPGPDMGKPQGLKIVNLMCEVEDGIHDDLQEDAGA